MEAFFLFRALADKTRLRLLHLVESRELNVQELTCILGMAQSRVSHHLKTLQAAGLSTSRRDGLWSFYRASDHGAGRRFIDSIRYLFEEDPELRRDLQRAEEVLRAGRLQSRRFFDSLASNWETVKRTVIGDLDLVGEIAARLPADTVVADLGCGSGDLLERMSGRSHAVIGVDSSRNMLEEASRRLKAQGMHCDLRIGELEHLPLADAEAEAAVINLVLHHLRTPLDGLREAGRVLREGGTLIVADFYRHGEELLRSCYGDRWLGFSAGELEDWLRPAGFLIRERAGFPVRLELTLFIWVCMKRGALQAPPIRNSIREEGVSK